MTSLTNTLHPIFALPSWNKLIFGLLPKGRRPRVFLEEETRARRAFVTEMLDRNPEAFSSAEDVQAMMSCFPDRF